ncbi:hypothetical protein ISS42_02435 [Candidatus Shapirobacteria bacterium]|nr:hypothetical protein [Candidatus Shapirobacteria bacterium]
MDKEVTRGERTRGIGIRPPRAAEQGVVVNEPEIRPENLQTIRASFEGGREAVEEGLADQGFVFREVELPEKGVVQVLVYSQAEVEEAGRLTEAYQEEQDLPEGFVASGGKVLALPIAWTDTKTGMVTIRVEEGGGVKMTTWDRAVTRSGRGKAQSVILHSGKVYPAEGWKRKAPVGPQAALAEEGMAAPWAGEQSSGGSTPQPIKYQSTDPNHEYYHSSGVYKPKPGSRYGFMGWTGSKKG